MKAVRGMCALKFRISGDEASFEIGWVWIGLIVVLIYVL